jgi:hypothetical protein
MYTIDEFIERLEQLRDVAANGGETPVAVVNGVDDLEPAGVELVFATPDDTSNAISWIVRYKLNTTQVVRVF